MSTTPELSTTTTPATELATDSAPAPATTPASNLDMSNLPPLDVLFGRPTDDLSWAGDLELEEGHAKLDLEAAGAIDSAIERVSKETIWHKGYTLPPSATKIFCNQTLRALLCAYCTDFANGGIGNIVFDNDGKLIQVFCGSCRFRIRSHAGACTGGHEGCAVHRHVSPLGDVAPLCNVCHQAQTQTQRGKRGKRGGASRSSKQGNTAAKALPPKRLGDYVNV
jgi:hypothetical protein